MSNQESKNDAKIITGVFSKKKKVTVFTLECKTEKKAVLLFVTPKKKVQKCSDANHGKNEIVINEKSIDIILRSGEAEALKKENDFVLWINKKNGYEKLAVGKVK